MTKLAGQNNSSLTRVRPFFRELFKMDDNGQTWLPGLVRLANQNEQYAEKIANFPGTLLLKSVEKRRYHDRILAQYGIAEIDLENCFESSQPPPERFLRWLIEHPAQMKWPINSGKKSLYGTITQFRRERLVAGEQEMISSALADLEKHGVEGSKRKWWAFEGFTEVDCYLETDRFVLFIEGKRTEKMTPATNWYPQRNQIVRNLEVAQQTAKGREYAVLVIAEQDLETIKDENFVQSLPHFNGHERTEINKHFLGCTTWKKACHALGVDYAALPDKTADSLPVFARI